MMQTKNGFKNPYMLKIRSEYHSEEDFKIPPVIFEGASFNILKKS